MMATEATPDILAKSSTAPEYELNKTKTSNDDVTPVEQPVVNGTLDIETDGSKQPTDSVEANVNSAEVSINGGSDTEISKAETSKAQSGHVRSASIVKKATSFKPVSINNKFLATKAPAPAAKIGEKGSAGIVSTPTGTLTSGSRPRLVAKSGSSLRDSTPRNAAAANGTQAGAAPNASAVWNRNQPAPPPEPKRFTDEELKQRYGIHLATRLQSDDPGREKNWADIDDDDEDWAPDDIEWADGTKITLPQADEVPIPTPEPAPAALPPVLKAVKPIQVPKSKSPAPLQSASPTGKPSGFGSGRAGLVLKGAAEKPTLVAKPPGPPTPVKSPWASLPPVDKVAPINIEIPQSQPPTQGRFAQRDPHGFQGMPPPPAKEIAADDFSRSWRDGNVNASRELYDSKSGRYEPVNDGRRGSTRNDARQPAVLQRPSQDGGPAEPSAAFQTHRATGQDPSFARRRTSSNVSGGSGNFARRMSRSGHEMPPHEMLNLRRGSLAAVSDAPSSPREFSPSSQHPAQRGPPTSQNQPWASRASPAVSHHSPHSTHGQLAAPIPGPTDGQSAPPPVAALSEDQIFEAQKKRMLQSREAAIKRRQEVEAKEEAAKRERIRIRLEAMGPPPEKQKPKATTPKQEKTTPVSIQPREPTNIEPLPPKAEETQNAKVRPTVLEEEAAPAKLIADDETEPALINGTDGSEAKPSPFNIRQSQQEHKSAQSWQANSAPKQDRIQGQAPWAQPVQQQASRSVWGPPTNDRTLGNGTFNSELSRIPNMHAAPHPGPIGPPNQNRGQYSQARTGRDPFATRPTPIGPPNKQVNPRTEESKRLVSQSGWGNAETQIRESDAVARRNADAELARREEEKSRGIIASQPQFKETWRAVKVGEDGEREKEALEAPGVKAPEQNADIWRSPNANVPARPRDSSRFFPSNNRDIRLEEQNAPFDRPGSPSPPPPTMAGHPAYDGDVAHPQVHFPRPAPVVKLPPPAVVLAPIGPPAKPATFASVVTNVAPAVPMAMANHANSQGRQDYNSRSSSHQDIRKNSDQSGNWQDRINSLIGRNPKSSLAVDSSSKNALDLAYSQSTATVSLPSSDFGGQTADNASIFSKPAAEECFEEQEMGSLPIIKVPDTAPPAAWTPAPQPAKTLPKKFHASEVISREAVHFTDSISHGRFLFTVHLPEGTSKPVQGPYVPTTKQHSNPRRGGGVRGGALSRGNPSTPRSGKPKDSGFSSPRSETASAPSSSSHTGRGGHRGGRGSYGSNNWGRHVSTPVQT